MWPYISHMHTVLIMAIFHVNLGEPVVLFEFFCSTFSERESLGVIGAGFSDLPSSHRATDNKALQSNLLAHTAN